MKDPLEPITIEVSWLLAAVISGAVAALGSLGLIVFKALYKHMFPEPREAAASLLADLCEDTTSWKLFNDNSEIRNDRWCITFNGEGDCRNIYIMPTAANQPPFISVTQIFTQREFRAICREAESLLQTMKEEWVNELLS